MKKVLLSVVAAAAMATALPALAQPYGNAWGHPSNRGYNNYSPLQGRLDRLHERIERGLYNGSLTRGEARRLHIRVEQLARLERHFARDGFSPWERAELERRFDQLRMEIRFERRDDDRRWDRDWDDDRRGRRGW